MKNLFAVIVAGGSGTRMQNSLPKQFIPLKNKPILIHTIEKFLAIENCSIILVLPVSQQNYWNEIVGKYPEFEAKYRQRVTVVDGGETRFLSVKNGLSAIKSIDGLVAIHDGVRPMVSKQIILDGFKMAEKWKAVITCVTLKDSIREISEDETNKAVDRTNFRLVQTPQTFDIQLVKIAYEQNESPLFTDDASVVESLGTSITLIPGDFKNIKITTPEDLLIVESFLGS